MRNSKDLMMRRVRVAEVFGLARLVRTSEISPSEDMVVVVQGRVRCYVTVLICGTDGGKICAPVSGAHIVRT